MDTDIYRLVKEAMFFAKMYEKLTLAIFLGEDNAKKAQERGILRDINFLRTLGLNIIIGHYLKKLDTRNWFDIVNFRTCRLEDLDTIRKYLALGEIPVVFCEDTPELSSYHTMALLASNLGARKLVFITKYDGLYDRNSGHLIPEMNTEKARVILGASESVTWRMRSKIEAAILGVSRGISRVHIINGSRTGSLIREIFTNEGWGTMIHEINYKIIRQARPSEAIGIADILRLSTPPFFVPPADIIRSIGDWYVLAIDEQPHACMRLTLRENYCEVSYLTTSKAYEDQTTLQKLLWHAVHIASGSNMKKIFMEKTLASIWLGLYPWFFQDMGFHQSTRSACASNCQPSEAKNEVWIANL